MRCRAVRWSLLAVVLGCMAANAAIAQTIEFGTAAPGEGGSGRSIGGNIPAAPGLPDEDKPPAAPWYSVHGQGTMLTSLQDGTDQSRELRVGPDLEKCASPRSIHCLDLGDKLDRPRELACEQGAS